MAANDGGCDLGDDDLFLFAGRRSVFVHKRAEENDRLFIERQTLTDPDEVL
jgi:hypothetical protein